MRGVDPLLIDLAAKECINVECRCGRVMQLAPYQLIGRHGSGVHAPGAPNSGKCKATNQLQNHLEASKSCRREGKFLPCPGLSKS